MKKTITTLLLFISLQAVGQKKVIPAANSGTTGITLPAGSKKDMRPIFVSAAKAMLEMESKKTGVKLKTTEVFYLPSAAANTFTEEFLTNALQQQGWQVAPVQSKNYYRLQKEGKIVFAYFSAEKKEPNLYFAEADGSPSNDNNNPTQTQNVNIVVTPEPAPAPAPVPEPTATSGSFAFTTTNFDDGWTSTVQEDWVEATKGSVKVLLHFPKEGTIFPADPEPLTNAAWNILVAPRYSNLKNYKTAYIATSDRPYLGMGYATENATGKNVFIVFFHQGYTGWLEFITPDKNTFIQQYKFDPEAIQWDSNTDLMIPLANMTGYNKFAIASSDLKGKWTSDFTGIQQLYNVYTGQYAGMNINQSSQEFIFNADNSYTWKLLAVNGIIGNVSAVEVKSAGQFTVPNNWQVYFSKIESRAHTFHAFWSCIKGARVLNLLDANAPGSGIYTKYGLAK